MDLEEIQEHTQNLSRRPFRDILARLLAHAPSDQAIVAQAEKNPDRWGQTTALIARLGGYNEKLEIEASVTQRIQALSDSELALELEALRRELDKESSHQGSEAVDSIDVP